MRRWYTIIAMSLDARIQQIARDEAQRAVASMGTSPHKTAGVGELQQQVSDLHEHLHRALTQIDHLTQRVSTLEAAQTSAAQHQYGDSDSATPLPEAAEPRATRPRRSSRGTGKTT